MKSCRIIHRDLKLSNVMLSKSLDVKVGDFGFAKTAQLDQSQSVAGTPLTMAPEILFYNK